jgi:hypothetical protein
VALTGRVRRRERLRLLTLEMPDTAIDAAVARGFLKLEDSTQAWSVIQSVYATQLSARALSWLTDNAVITTEERRRQHDSHGVDVTTQPDETRYTYALSAVASTAT